MENACHISIVWPRNCFCFFLIFATIWVNFCGWLIKIRLKFLGPVINYEWDDRNLEIKVGPRGKCWMQKSKLSLWACEETCLYNSQEKRANSLSWRLISCLLIPREHFEAPTTNKICHLKKIVERQLPVTGVVTYKTEKIDLCLQMATAEWCKLSQIINKLHG